MVFLQFIFIIMQHLLEFYRTNHIYLYWTLIWESYRALVQLAVVKSVLSGKSCAHYNSFPYIEKRYPIRLNGWLNQTVHADFIYGILTNNDRKLVLSFNITYRYIDDVFSINNCKLGDFVSFFVPLHFYFSHCIIWP